MRDCPQARHLAGAQDFVLGRFTGHSQAEVAERIDVFVVALFHGMRVDGVSDLDLS